MSDELVNQLREIVRLGGIKHPGHLHQIARAADELEGWRYGRPREMTAEEKAWCEAETRRMHDEADAILKDRPPKYNLRNRRPKT